MADEVKEALRAQVLEMYDQGMSGPEIGRRLGIPTQQAAGFLAVRTKGSDGTNGANGDAEVVVGSKFSLERDMQTALRRHITRLDPGLTIVDGDKEHRVDGGRIDILAKDNDGTRVVIELKADVAPEDAIAQVLDYVGALEEQGQPARGILVARKFPRRVQRAARQANIQLFEYEFEFTFTTVD